VCGGLAEYFAANTNGGPCVAFFMNNIIDLYILYGAEIIAI